MRKRKRTSPVWSVSKNKLEEIVKKSNSLSSILKYFGLNWTGGNHRTLKKRLIEEEIDYSHIKLGQNSNKGRKFPSKAIPLEEVMVENSTYSRGHLKNRLLKNGMLENKCEICGQNNIWNGKELTMILDHINGVNNDHRRENLQMLCPNCNIQQPTFGGKCNKKHYYCEECGEAKKYKHSQLCNKCSAKKNNFNRRKVKDRPSEEQLLKEIKETNYCAVGKKYGVTDNTIRKWLK